MLWPKEGIPSRLQRFIYKGKELDDDAKELHEVHIGNKSTLELMVCSDVEIIEC
jgi:hypothetical protein